METGLIIGIILLVIIVFLNGFLVWRLSAKKSETVKEEAGWKVILEQMNNLSRVVDQKIGETTKEVADALRHQFSESAKLIKDVTAGLTKLDETNRQVISFTDQLRNLQDILKNPKQRGILGEYYLETLLKNVLPPSSYQMQYTFPDGTKVDAAVFIKDKIVPVDSKFSLENYNKFVEAPNETERVRFQKIFLNDLKQRIVETSKYIQPEQGTTDFAFMFIPHEAIYYDLLVNKIGDMAAGADNLIERAAGKYHVIIVSPTSFLAYLQTVLQGLKALQIEETAKEIRKRVEELGRHLKSYGEYHRKLGASLGVAVSHYNASGKAFRLIDKDVMRITDTSPGLETDLLDKPEEE
jgi:DNA recombination protein RmuC